MLKRLTAIFTIVTLLSGQAFASDKQIELQLGELARNISNGTSKVELLRISQEVVDAAKESGMTTNEFVQAYSDRFGLELTEEEISETIAKVQADTSAETVDELASKITENAEGERLIFAGILLLLLIFLKLGGA